MHHAGLGSGQPTDFYLYIGDSNTEACLSGAAAWASACDLGFRNRPVLGVANLCPGFWAMPEEVQLTSMVHELLHALVGGCRTDGGAGCSVRAAATLHWHPAAAAGALPPACLPGSQAACAPR